MTLDIANYEIVVAPAGMAVLAILLTIAIVGLALLVRRSGEGRDPATGGVRCRD